MDNENPISSRHKFGEPISGHILATMLRALADDIDKGGMNWTHFHRWRELVEGDPVADDKGQLWKTWQYTQAGALQIAWSLDTSGDVTAEAKVKVDGNTERIMRARRHHVKQMAHDPLTLKASPDETTDFDEIASQVTET